MDNIESQVCFCTLNLFGWVVFLRAHMFVEGHILFGCVLMEMSVQVSNAVTNVQSGTTALQSAKKHQKSSRKWMCIAIIILLIIVAVIVVGVIKPWKSGNS